MARLLNTISPAENARVQEVQVKDRVKRSRISRTGQDRKAGNNKRDAKRQTVEKARGTKEECVESLQSHMILTMSHWSSGLPVCFPPQGSQVQIPWGDLCGTGILLLALSRYIGDPDVIDHQQGFVPNCH